MSKISTFCTRVTLCAVFSFVAAWSQDAPAPKPPQTPQEHLDRWAGLARYHDQNLALAPPEPAEDRVVFMGDSITDGWSRGGTIFQNKRYINRGMSGQTTPQMVARFRADVIALKPKVVVILAGTNDIAGNTGPTTLEQIEVNLMSMVELASANGIRVVLSSILPAYDYPWRKGLEPAPKIATVNAWEKDYAASHNLVYLDYHSAMVDDRPGLKPELSGDGVHPNKAGYVIMEGLVEKAIAQALAH